MPTRTPHSARPSPSEPNLLNVQSGREITSSCANNHLPDLRDCDRHQEESWARSVAAQLRARHGTYADLGEELTH